jgi:hypothetical protein
MMQTKYQGSDHVIEARAEAAAGDDSAREFCRVEIDLLPWAGGLKTGRFIAGLEI